MSNRLLDDISQFLDKYPRMSIVPFSDKGIYIRGIFNFKAIVEEEEEIEDSYKLEIIIPDKFPRALPVIKEIGNKIPKTEDFHINEDDESFCLGSPYRLLIKLSNSPSLIDFINQCLIPYLYAVSFKLKNGGKFILGELDHGNKGIFEDYCDLFGLSGHNQVIQVIELLSVKKRVANKRPCPCGCGKRLGACPFHKKLNELRKMAPVAWFKAHAKNDWTKM